MKKTITTSKQLLFAFCLVAATLLTGCSDDNDEPRKSISPEEQQEGSTQVTTGDLTFDISEKPFGADIEEGTRTPEPPVNPDTVEIADNVAAEVVIERDHIPATRALPKQLRNGTYTIYAIQGGAIKGTLAFTVENGQIKTQLNHMRLPAGTYDICCMNDKVRYYASPINSFGMNHQRAGQELFGVIQNYYISGASQKIPISIMRHSARIRTKITAMMDFPTNVRTKLYSTVNTMPENILRQGKLYHNDRLYSYCRHDRSQSRNSESNGGKPISVCNERHKAFRPSAANYRWRVSLRSSNEHLCTCQDKQYDTTIRIQ